MEVDVRTGGTDITAIRFADNFVLELDAKNLRVKNTVSGKSELLCKLIDAVNLEKALQLAQKVWGE